MKIKKLFFFIFFLLVILGKPLDAAPYELGTHVLINTPLKKSSDEPGLALGFLLDASYHELKQFSLHLKSGFIYGFKKDLFGAKTQTNMVPISLACQYFLAQQNLGESKLYYLDYDIGANFISTEFSGISTIDKKKTTALVLASGIGGGYRYQAFDFNLKLNFYDLSVHHLLNYSGLSFSFGYHFSFL